jgi:hypothetical protein|tara:strand:+ start:214 stop:753 length:540 start_codon:yes stop_codon:yes gene_type:complete
MSVLNVLDTQTVSGSGTAYIVVKSGVVRAYAASASSIQFDAGPAVTLAAGEAILLSVGKSKNVSITGASDAATCVFTVGGVGAGQRHNFAVGDYIQTIDGGDTDGFVAAFETAASAGKKVTAVTNTTVTTDYDSSSASAAYAISEADVIANNVPQLQRTVKLTAGSADVVVEQVQIVGG